MSKPEALPTDGESPDNGGSRTPASVDPELLQILRCPESGSELVLVGDELWCRDSRRAYPIQNGLPVLLIDEARSLTEAELATRE